MTRNIRVRGIKRKAIDEDKLALAFLLLAKIIDERERGTSDSAKPDNDNGDARGAAVEAA